MENIFHYTYGIFIAYYFEKCIMRIGTIYTYIDGYGEIK